MGHPIEVDVDGQIYRFIGHEEYPNAKSGYLAVWQSNCPSCGASFDAKFPGPFTKTRLTRRCKLHRAPGMRVKAQLAAGLALPPYLAEVG